jgi:hypothetical protein
MNLEVLGGSIGLPVLIAAITGWISGWLASRRALAAAAADRRRRAAAALREAVQDLHDLLWNAYIGARVNGLDVADLMEQFDKSVRRHEDLLPADGRHLRRSAREAMSCAVGAPAASPLHVDAQSKPVDVLNGYWADVSLTWLEHAVRQFHRWEDRPQSRQLDLVPYYQWRRDEDDAARAQMQAVEPREH